MRQRYSCELLKLIFPPPHILLHHPFSSFLYIQTPSLHHTCPLAPTRDKLFENWVSSSCIAALLSARPVVPSFLSSSMECSQLVWLLSPQCWQLTYWNPSTTLVGRQEMVCFRLCPLPAPMSAVLLFYLDFLTNSFSSYFLSLCPFQECKSYSESVLGYILSLY